MTKKIVQCVPAGLLILLTLAVGMAILSPMPLHAQTFYGSIVGTVTDSSGAIVPGATVTITDIATNTKHTAQSNGTGDYSFVSLVPSTYTVDVQKSSFKRFERQQVTVQVNSTVRIDAPLQVGETTETVEVTTQTPLLQTDSGSLGAVVEGKTVEQMPLNGRNTMNLLSLAPGVVPTNNSQGGTALGSGGHTTTSNWGAYSIGGGLTGFNAMFLDGSTLNVLGGGGAGTIAFVPTQDAVQEFNVSSNASSSEFGRYSGGVVNMTTKSGTNALHGTAYEYVRNKILNANEFFNKQSELAKGQANTPSQWNQNQYGVTVDGPIKKDKIFFMGSWEAFSARLATLQSRVVPSPDMLAGWILGKDVTAFLHDTTKDPFTPGTAACPGATVGTSPSGVAGSTYIPSNCVDPTAKVMMTEWPVQNTPSSSNNMQKLSGTGSDTNNIIGRVDYNLSDKQRLFARFTRAILIDETQEWMPGGVDPSGKTWHIGGGTTHNRALSGVVGDTYTINPTTIADVRLSVMRVYNDQVPPTEGMNMSIFGANWANLQTKMTLSNIPTLGFSNETCPSGVLVCVPTGFGNAGQISYQWNDNESLVFSLTKILGRHNLKTGGETRFMDRYMLSESGGTASAGGNFSFSNAYFAGTNWANFLIGMPNSAYLTTVRETGTFSWYQGYYVNDTWQATRKLTINAGLRWELPGNVKEKHNNMMELEPTATATTGVNGTGYFVSSSKYSDRGTEPARHDLFVPNLGFAYRITNNDVVRGGYGYNLAPIDIQGGMFPEAISMNTYSNSWSADLAGTFPLSNPYPSGLTQPLGRNGTDAMFLKQNMIAPVLTNKYPYTQQWNLSVSHQFKGDTMVEVGYSGSLAVHLPMTGVLNELPTKYWGDLTLTSSTKTSQPTTTVPAAQLAACESLWNSGNTYTTYGQCARTYWAYQNFNDAIGPTGTTNYNSMPVRVMKRFRSGSLVTASYTWSKALGNTGGGAGAAQNPGGGVQDWYNLKAEKSITAFDIPRRLVVSYVLNLPFGKGGIFLKDVSNPVTSRLVSGWTVNGITTFQTGFPVSIGASEPGGAKNVPNTFGAGLRPNYTPGCAKLVGGSWKSHVLAGTSVLNNSCWTAPSLTTLGNEPRIDYDVKAPGNNNWDLSVSKKTDITERFNLEFRAEFFNVFNHVRFGAPGQTLNGGGGTPFGIINSGSSGENQPRLGQLSLRMSF